MKNLHFNVVALAVALLAGSSAVADDATKQAQPKQGQGQQITLSIEGVECAGCARVVTETLQGTELKPTEKIKPNASGPTVVTVSCPAECKLGAVAAKIAAAETPHREKTAPSLSLVLFAELKDDQRQKAIEACRDIDGVAGCEYDADRGQLCVKLGGDQEVTARQIVQGLSDAGVQVRTTSKTSATTPGKRGESPTVPK